MNLYSISVQNEPDYASERTVWSTDETTDFLANYADQITSTSVMSPNPSGIRLKIRHGWLTEVYTDSKLYTGDLATFETAKDMYVYAAVNQRVDSTLSHQVGITISGSGAKSVTVKASSQSGAILKLCKGSAAGYAVAYIEIPAGGMQEITAPVTGLSGQQNLFLISSGNASVDNWKLNP